MDKAKILQTLGLARNGNKFIYGHRLFEIVKDGTLRYIIIATDMGASQKEKLINQCKHYEIPYDDQNFTKEELSKATGLKMLVALGIADQNLYRLLTKYI